MSFLLRVGKDYLNSLIRYILFKVKLSVEMKKFFTDFANKHLNFIYKRNMDRQLPEILDAIMVNAQFKDLGISPIQQLGIEVSGHEDLLELKCILSGILHYPSTELAELHRQCFRLGNEDIDETGSYLNFQGDDESDKIIQFCPCCGFIKQEQKIKVNTPFSDIKNLGVSTNLYFQTIINTIMLLGVIFVVYGIYSLSTNIIATSKADQTRSLPSAISLSAKQSAPSTQQNQDFYYIQCWVGLLTVILWSFCILMIKMHHIEKKSSIRETTKSCSDYSIALHNVPVQMDDQTLQYQLERFYKRVSSEDNQSNLKKLKIVKYNRAMPFYLNKKIIKSPELQEINKEIKQITDKAISWIKYRMDKKHKKFPLSQKKRTKIYEEYEKLIAKKQEVEQLTMEKAKQEFLNRAYIESETTSAFVTFQSSYAKDILAKQQLDAGWKTFRYYVLCCFGRNRFEVKDKDGYNVEVFIQEAPEPEDIIWEHIGYPWVEIIKKKMITFLMTLFLLAASFFLAFGLNQKDVNPQQDLILSFVISLTITGFNLLIIALLKKLTKKEKNLTETNHQASLGVKAAFALIVNNIITPLIVHVQIENDTYDQGGLVENIFFLGLTNAFVPVVIKVFDYRYFPKRLYAWWLKKPKNKLYIDQPKLNYYQELTKFQVGYDYVYIISLYLFCCFFSSLQPIIILFAIPGMGLMFWVQKYSVFNRYKRPVPGGSIIDRAMLQFIDFGPIAFSLGNFTWSNFLPEGEPKQAMIPNLISCVIALIIFVFPYHIIIKSFKRGHNEQEEFYSQNRIFLPSQYDRINPSTSKQAVKEYRKFFQQYRQNLKYKSNHELRKIQQMFAKQFGHYHKPIESKQVEDLQSLLVQSIRGTTPEENYSSNPMMMYNSLLPDSQRKIKFRVGVQNWITKWQKKAQFYQQNDDDQLPFSQLIPGMNRQNQDHRHSSHPNDYNDPFAQLSYKLANQKMREE